MCMAVLLWRLTLKRADNPELAFSYIAWIFISHIMVNSLLSVILPFIDIYGHIKQPLRKIKIKQNRPIPPSYRLKSFTIIQSASGKHYVPVLFEHEAQIRQIEPGGALGATVDCRCRLFHKPLFQKQGLSCLLYSNNIYSSSRCVFGFSWCSPASKLLFQHAFRFN